MYYHTPNEITGKYYHSQDGIKACINKKEMELQSYIITAKME